MYRHEAKAGNRADVWKHCLLLSVLERMQPGRARFHYCETHAGEGSYRLKAGGVWETGIGRVMPPPVPLSGHVYFELQQVCLTSGGDYLGSWRLVEAFLSRQGQDHSLLLHETDEGICRRLMPRLGRHVELRCRDGFGFDPRSQPHPDLVLIDPPYHPHPGPDRHAALALMKRLSASGIPHLLWYPLLGDGWEGQLTRGSGHTAVELVWPYRGQGMRGAGMLLAGTPGIDPAWFGQLARALGGKLIVH